MNIAKVKGNIVPIPGMYNHDFSLNLESYKKFIEKKISDGDRIFYLAKSASEFKYMGADERLEITKLIGKYTEISGVVVLSQPLGSGSIKSQIEEAKQMSDYGVSAIVVLPTEPVLSGKFISSYYAKSGFSGEKHGSYYVEYMEKFSQNLNVPLIFHDKQLSNNIGLPIEYLDLITQLDSVKGIKAHSSDPYSLRSIYKRYSSSHLCFDGHAKTVQFWSAEWGATARHTCWSWFDSKSDQEFYLSLTKADFKTALEIIEREWGLAKEIIKTGFAGYKEIMRIINLSENNLTRVPGLTISVDESNRISAAYHNYKKLL